MRGPVHANLLGGHACSAVSDGMASRNAVHVSFCSPIHVDAHCPGLSCVARDRCGVASAPGVWAPVMDGRLRAATYETIEMDDGTLGMQMRAFTFCFSFWGRGRGSEVPLRL